MECLLVFVFDWLFFVNKIRPKEKRILQYSGKYAHHHCLFSVLVAPTAIIWWGKNMTSIIWIKLTLSSEMHWHVYCAVSPSVGELIPCFSDRIDNEVVFQTSTFDSRFGSGKLGPSVVLTNRALRKTHSGLQTRTEPEVSKRAMGDKGHQSRNYIEHKLLFSQSSSMGNFGGSRLYYHM